MTSPLSYAAALSKGIPELPPKTTNTNGNKNRNTDKVPLFDIGINLGSSKYKNYHKTLLDNAAKQGVQGVISISNSKSEWELNLSLINQFRNHSVKIFCTIGVHPHDAKSVSLDKLNDFKDSIVNFIYDNSPGSSDVFASDNASNNASNNASDNGSNNKKVVAIGECGLDYNRMFSPKHVQIEVFKAHVEVAAYLNLPLYIHERDSGEDMIKLLTEAKNRYPNLRGVIHCFTGKKETMIAYLKLGFYIGITGWICDDRRNKDLIEAVSTYKKTSNNASEFLDRLMIETDGPWLTPPEFSKITYEGVINFSKNVNNRNESSSLPYIVERISQVTGYSADEIRKAVLKNTMELFHI